MEQVKNKMHRLEEDIATCTKCRLHKGRKNAVPGSGPYSASVMVVGEAPGRQEDEAGKPFVGAAGRLLDYLLTKAGLKREEVYITNVVKCRPPKNRDPMDDEIATCLPYLVEQIRLLKPKVIITVGRIAGRTIYRLTGLKWRGVKAEHGVMQKGRIEGLDVTIIPTYHPAAALYKPDIRNVLEEDFGTTIRQAIAEALQGDQGPRRRRTLIDFMS